MTRSLTERMPAPGRHAYLSAGTALARPIIFCSTWPTSRTRSATRLVEAAALAVGAACCAASGAATANAATRERVIERRIGTDLFGREPSCESRGEPGEGIRQWARSSDARVPRGHA